MLWKLRDKNLHLSPVKMCGHMTGHIIPTAIFVWPESVSTPTAPLDTASHLSCWPADDVTVMVSNPWAIAVLGNVPLLSPVI